VTTDTITLAGCLALLGEDAQASDGPVDIVLRAGRIARITPAGSAPPEGRVVDARGRLCTPGLVNGHTHSHEGFFKGRHENLPLELWMNNVRPNPPIAFTERQVYLRTLIGAIEALRSGTTTIIDDLNVSPTLDPRLVEAAFRAYRDIGIRAYVGITLFDRPFFRGMPMVDEMFPPALLAELDALPKPDGKALLAFFRDLAGRYHWSRDRVSIIAAPSAPQRCTDDFLRAIRAMADELDLPAMIHVQETRLQAVSGPLIYGCTMIEHLGRLGFLKPRTTLIHGVWLRPQEVALIAASGATVQHNPLSNMKLGSGVAPVRALLDAGINVSLGTDGCGSIETVNMQAVLAGAALLHKLRGDDPARWVGAAEAFRAGTLGGATALGRGQELGTIAEGRIADLALYRLESIPFTPLNNPLGQLVYNETGASLDMLFVDGAPVVQDGRLTQIDETTILAEIGEEHRALLPEIQRAERDAGRISEAYRRIVDACRVMALAPDTFEATLRH
jgi:5-methylthioadenosine/S-adenosylhomocysteine deaminase